MALQQSILEGLKSYPHATSLVLTGGGAAILLVQKIF